MFGFFYVLLGDIFKLLMQKNSFLYIFSKDTPPSHTLSGTPKAQNKYILKHSILLTKKT